MSKRSKSGPTEGEDAGLPVRFEDVSAAAFRIRGGVVRTDCRHSRGCSELLGVELYFKEDFRQATGSFKERGARNTMMQLDAARRKRGVVAASAGNHALGLAYHGRDLDIPVTVVMPRIAPLTKIQNCRSLGANVIIHGAHIGEAREYAEEQFVKGKGLTYINGYDHPHIIAGAGTVGLEILEQVADVDAIVVPVGGGGLIAGISLAVKKVRPDVQVIGVEPKRCASLLAALHAGRVVPVNVRSTLADGLAVPTVGANAFELARRFVDKVVTVDERDIALAVLRLVELEKSVVEGAGATGLAAIIAGALPELQGKKVVIPLCGGNIDTAVLGRVIERGLAVDGRLVRFVATVKDRPGGVANLTKILSDMGVSIKDIYHERAWLGQDVAAVDVKCVAETRSKEHGEELRAALAAKYPLRWGPSRVPREGVNLETPVEKEPDDVTLVSETVGCIPTASSAGGGGGGGDMDEDE